jgi:hypothetical protein
LPRWQDIVESAPEFAAALRQRLDAHVHKTIATVRADGSPRIRGIEPFSARGDIWIGSMLEARKGRPHRRKGGWQPDRHPALATPTSSGTAAQHVSCQTRTQRQRDC